MVVGDIDVSRSRVQTQVEEQFLACVSCTTRHQIYREKFVPLQLVYPNIDMKKLKESQETMLRAENVDHFIKDLECIIAA